MRKEILALVILLSAFLLFSCKESENNIIDNSDDKEGAITNTVEEKEETEEPKQNEDVVKPETIDEIIEFADKLNVDTSMTAFTLEGILEEAQPELSEDGGDDYQNETAYLGDSVTLGLSFFKNHPSKMVIAKGSINPMDAVDKKLIELDDGTMVNFPDALKLTGAKRAVLTFGSNAISVMSEETFLKYYIKLIDAIQETSPDCQIIIQSITPLATTCTLKKLTNPLVNRSNLLLLVLAYSRDLYFLDSTSQMKDENGYLKIEFCSSSDGIHINEKGYEVWIDMLRRHVVE